MVGVIVGVAVIVAVGASVAVRDGTGVVVGKGVAVGDGDRPEIGPQEASMINAAPHSAARTARDARPEIPLGLIFRLVGPLLSFVL